MLEQVRRTLAFGNECEYCMVKGGRPQVNKKDLRTSTATAFAELFVLDHRSVNEAHFSLLRTLFTDKEVSELCVFISFITASQKFGRIMNLTEDLQMERMTRLENQNDLFACTKQFPLTPSAHFHFLNINLLLDSNIRNFELYILIYMEVEKIQDFMLTSINMIFHQLILEIKDHRS